MTRVLILGGTGMLGHKLVQLYQYYFDTWTTIRACYQDYSDFFPKQTGIYKSVDPFQFGRIANIIDETHPDVVVNCIGVIKQLPTATDPIISLTINSLFPNRLAKFCQTSRIRLIHVSTDCVFNGRKGMYTEEDISNAEDLYGRTKFLGEVTGPNCLTLRTSIIGRELRSSNGLLEWFLSNRGQCIKGFTKAIYTGFTTTALGLIIREIIEDYPGLSGLYHVASKPINKYDLLCLANRVFDAGVEIRKDNTFICDRSLDSTRFCKETNIKIPTWESMIEELGRE